MAIIFNKKKIFKSEKWEVRQHTDFKAEVIKRALAHLSYSSGNDG